MLVSSLRKALKTHSFSNTLHRSFSVLNPQYYHNLFQQETLSKDIVVEKTLKVKIDAKGRTEEIKLYGLPLKPLPVNEQGFNEIMKDVFKNLDDQPLFFQVDPTKYLYSQRLLVSKTDVPETKTDEIQKLLTKDPIHPFTWDEAIASSEVIAKLYKPKQTGEGEEPEFKDEEAEKEQLKILTEKFGEKAQETYERNQKIIRGVYDLVLDTNIGKYPDMNNILVSAFVANQPAVLGGMPKILKRLILGNSLRLQDLKSVFKSCCLESRKALSTNNKIKLSQVAKYLFPELFYAPDVIYMSVMLKEMMASNKEGFKAFVGIDYIDPIFDHWNDEKIVGAKYSDMIGMPARNASDDVDTLIEKHVILDMLIGDRVWDLPYVNNQFPYLSSEENTDATIVELRKSFYIQYQRYSAAKQKIFGKDE